MNTLKGNYLDGVCPDCAEEIPDDVMNGDVCNCGHIFWDGDFEDEDMELPTE